ncbi:Uncharacterised protein [Mycobacteroides abscessus subsp. abscessus]|nr:Uncharacterised protein [Mycobacteroides abscessus subsp. abscessus]
MSTAALVDPRVTQHGQRALRRDQHRMQPSRLQRLHRGEVLGVDHDEVGRPEQHTEVAAFQDMGEGLLLGEGGGTRGVVPAGADRLLGAGVQPHEVEPQREHAADHEHREAGVQRGCRRR